MLNIVITAAVFYAVLVGVMYVMQRHFLYYPTATLSTRAESGVADMEEIRFTTADGVDLFAWIKPPADAGKPWVVLFHGNAGTIGSRGFKARVFLDAGYGVMLPEYRGYGGNAGQPTEAGLFNDARAALAQLDGRDAGGVVLYGESLGTGVAVAMAAEMAADGRPARALILEAPFTSTVDVGKRHYPFLPVGLLMKDRFDSLDRIRDVQTPVFIAHGGKDWTVQQKLGRRLYDAASLPKDAMWPAEAGHNDLFEHGLGQAALAFLKAHQI